MQMLLLPGDLSRNVALTKVHPYVQSLPERSWQCPFL